MSTEQTYCVNRNDRFPCEHGCCGDYKDQHCCSFAGLIVGIIIGVALLIAVIAGIVYCWLKKHWRKGARDPVVPSNHNCRGGNVTVLHQSRTMAFTTGMTVVVHLNIYIIIIVHISEDTYVYNCLRLTL